MQLALVKLRLDGNKNKIKREPGAYIQTSHRRDLNLHDVLGERFVVQTIPKQVAKTSQGAFDAVGDGLFLTLPQGHRR